MDIYSFSVGPLGDIFMIWDRLTETPILVALIGLLSAAIVVPLVKKHFFDVRSRMHIEVRAFPHLGNVALKNAAGIDALDALWAVATAKGAIQVTIKNVSRKKISGVTVSVSNDFLGEMFCQIEEAAEYANLRRTKAILVGDIQPGHVRVLHIWTNFDRSDSLKIPAPIYLNSRGRSGGF